MVLAAIATRRWIGYGLTFGFLVCLSLAWTLPLSMVNRLLPNDIQLLGVSGNIAKGSWQAVNVHKQRYPLACQYQRQAVELSGVNYQLHCTTPFMVEGKISVSWGGDVTVSDGLLSGDLHAASPWFGLLGVPMQISGEVNLSLAKARVAKQSLTHLDMTGGAQNIHVFGSPILHQVRLETLNPTLSANQPIQLEIRTPEDDKTPETQWLQLYATSLIDGIHYQTRGEISGQRLKKYATMLRFFGQQTGSDRFAIQLQGTLL